jgi:proteic killer suppression protein
MNGFRADVRLCTTFLTKGPEMWYAASKHGKINLTKRSRIDNGSSRRPVIIAFSTRKLRSLCESQTKAEGEYGIRVAKELRARLADIREANSVLDLPAGRPREIDGNPHKHYAVDLADGYRLVLCINHSKVPLLKSRRVDWANVSRIKVHRIEVKHG